MRIRAVIFLLAMLHAPGVRAHETNGAVHRSWAVGKFDGTQSRRQCEHIKELGFECERRTGGPGWDLIGKHRHTSSNVYDYELWNPHKAHHGGNGPHAQGHWHYACVDDDRGRPHIHEEASDEQKAQGTGTWDGNCPAKCPPEIRGHQHSLTTLAGQNEDDPRAGLGPASMHNGMSIFHHMAVDANRVTVPHDHFIGTWDCDNPKPPRQPTRQTPQNDPGPPDPGGQVPTNPNPSTSVVTTEDTTATTTSTDTTATKSDTTNIIVPIAPVPGDFDGNGDVDMVDYDLFRMAFGSDNEHFDLNDDGRVDFADLVLFAAILRTS